MTTRFLKSIGFTRGMIDGRVRRHGWKSVGRGAYRVIPVRDHRDEVRSAVAALERAIVSHESAAEIHGIRRVPRGKAVVSVHSRTTHEFEAVEVHRTHDLDEWHITSADDLPVTTIERTVVDLAGSRSVGHVGAIVDDLVTRRRVDLQALASVAQSVARRGKPGTTTV